MQKVSLEQEHYLSRAEFLQAICLKYMYLYVVRFVPSETTERLGLFRLQLCESFSPGVSGRNETNITLM